MTDSQRGHHVRAPSSISLSSICSSFDLQHASFVRFTASDLDACEQRVELCRAERVNVRDVIHIRRLQDPFRTQALDTAEREELVALPDDGGPSSDKHTLASDPTREELRSFVMPRILVSTPAVRPSSHIEHPAATLSTEHLEAQPTENRKHAKIRGLFAKFRQDATSSSPVVPRSNSASSSATLQAPHDSPESARPSSPGVLRDMLKYATGSSATTLGSVSMSSAVNPPSKKPGRPGHKASKSWFRKASKGAPPARIADDTHHMTTSVDSATLTSTPVLSPSSSWTQSPYTSSSSIASTAASSSIDLGAVSAKGHRPRRPSISALRALSSFTRRNEQADCHEIGINQDGLPTDQELQSWRIKGKENADVDARTRRRSIVLDSLVAEPTGSRSPDGSEEDILIIGRRKSTSQRVRQNRVSRSSEGSEPTLRITKLGTVSQSPVAIAVDPDPVDTRCQVSASGPRNDQDDVDEQNLEQDFLAADIYLQRTATSSRRPVAKVTKSPRSSTTLSTSTPRKRSDSMRKSALPLSPAHPLSPFVSSASQAPSLPRQFGLEPRLRRCERGSSSASNSNAGIPSLGANVDDVSIVSLRGPALLPSSKVGPENMRMMNESQSCEQDVAKPLIIARRRIAPEVWEQVNLSASSRRRQSRRSTGGAEVV